MIGGEREGLEGRERKEEGIGEGGREGVERDWRGEGGNGEGREE